jgi:hypothetical protein
MSAPFSIPESLRYNAEIQSIDGDIHVVRYTPVSGVSFTPSQVCKLRLTSANEFLIPSKSYLRYDIAFTSDTIANVRTSTLGGASVLKTITTSIAGLQIESIDNYNAYIATSDARLPDSHKNLLKQTEGLGNTSAFSVSTGRSVYHAPRIALMEQDKHIPLAFFGGGIDLDLTFEELAKVQSTTGGSPTTYTITNVEFVATMLKPSDSYLQAYQSSLASGKFAKMALQLVRNMRLTPSATTEQEANLFTGVLRSLRSVIGVNRLTASFGAGADTFASFDNEDLRNYYFQIGSNRYPRNKAIECANASGVIVQSEHLMQALCSVDNTYSHFNQPDSYASVSDYIFFNWASNPSLGSGAIVEDGNLTLVRSFVSAPTTTSTTDLFLIYDAVLKFNATDFSLDTKEF